jgi:hypothetical protein
MSGTVAIPTRFSPFSQKMARTVIPVRIPKLAEAVAKNGFIVKSKVHSSKYSKSQKAASTLCSSKTLRSLIDWSWNI